MANNSGRVRKVSGYAKRVFFNDNIEYRDFSDDLVGLQLTSEGGTPLFTMGNFSITTNLDPTPSKTFNRGTFSDYFCLDNLSEEDNTYFNIEGNLSTQLNLDITNPLHYVWYGNFKEYLRVCLEDISNRWAAAIYVDNKVGSVSGNNITNYSYDPISDTSILNIPTKYFVNPFSVKYTVDSAFINDSEELSNLRNLTVNYTSYVIDINGVEYPIKEFTGSTVVTNGTLTVVVDNELLAGNTGTTESTPYFIKPKEQERENFFSSLNEFQRNILNRFTNPLYTVDIQYPEETDEGIVIYTNTKLSFPVLEDGYNLNLFDSLYISYLDELNQISNNFDDNQTNLMVRKYTAEIINSFDTAPRCDGDDLVNNGQKATNLLNIYGREFDEVKRYMNGIKYAHVVTYDKKDNVPDSLVKDLAWMLGFEKIDFLGNIDLSKNLLPSNGFASFSGYSKDYTLQEIDIELYRRIILNIAWLWKSKGARKAIEFLFRFIGAPESIVVFDEHVYVADKPLDIEQVKRLLYLYTGEVDLSNLPFDENGYPLPPVNGTLRDISYIDPSGVTQVVTEEIYFQKGGGWYRETGGSNAHLDINEGNNPHVGPYDGGTEYINYFRSNCFVPNYRPAATVFTAHTRLYENLFVNYNYGLINGIPVDFELYVSPLTLNNQLLSECINLTATIDLNCPPLSGGTTSTILEELCIQALQEYNEWLEKIKEDPYLIYSPEWEIVKRNNEVASKNYFDSVNAAACGDNACINICVDTVDSVDTNPCDEWVLVDDDKAAPFIYFTDADGNKVLFDDFPVCCVANGGIYKEFIFENGREACYCARSAPCNGLVPESTGKDGIIVWSLVDGDSNVPSVETAQVGDVCYTLTTLGQEAGITLDGIDSSKIGNDLTRRYLSVGYIQETPCHGDVKPITTKNVSAECCVWYGYTFATDSRGNIVCVDNSGVQGNTENATNTTEAEASLEVARKDYKKAVERYGEESIAAKSYEKVYNSMDSLYNTYTKKQSEQRNNLIYDTEKKYASFSQESNSNTTTSVYNTLTPQYNRLNKGVYLKYTTLDITSENFESAFESPELNDCVVWQPKVDQKTGFVTFQVTDVDGEIFYLPEDRELYKNCCAAKGYTFGCFERSGADGTLIPVPCEDNTTAAATATSSRKKASETGRPQFKKCVDPDFISCDSVDDVKLIFSANEWNGFLLPNEVDGECKVDITADIMIKYDAEQLLSCASENNCGFHYTQFDNSLYDLDCMNWITFTEYDNVLDDLRNNKQIVDLNQIVEWEEINPNYVVLGDYNTSQYVPYFDNNNISVWQTPGLQAEPNVECCEALGGEIVDTNQWMDYHQKGLVEIQKAIRGLFDIISNGLEPTETEELLYNSLVELQGINTEYQTISKQISCIDLTIFKLSERPNKGFNYTDLITTQTVCHLSVPTECGVYSFILEQYWTLINQIELTRVEIEECVETRETLTIELNTLIKEQRSNEVKINTINKECETLIGDYEAQLKECNDKINQITEQIKGLESTTKTVNQLSREEYSRLVEGCGKCDSKQLDAYLESNYDTIVVSDTKYSETYNKTEANKLYLLLEDTQIECRTISQKLESTKTECETQIGELKEQQITIITRIRTLREQIEKLSCCNKETLQTLDDLIVKVGSSRGDIVKLADKCYYEHNKEREENYQQYLADQVNQVLNYIDDLEICLTLEVDNTLGNQVDLNKRYTTLEPFTKTVWTFDPYKDYTGIFITGDETKVSAVEQSLFVKMRERYGDSSVTENTFVPSWQHTELPLTDTQLRQLKTQYPNRPFFIGVAIKNFECGVCVLVDNIQVKIETDEIERKFSLGACPSFDLRCVVDDRKSWVFSDGGVTKVIDVPGVKECNLPALSGNYNTIITYTQPQERRWLELEYREADYSVNHENLVINTKEASFRIDAAKAIECDVYNFWQQIDCESSGCTSGGTKSDCVVTGYTDICSCTAFTADSNVDPSDCVTCPEGYILEDDGVTCTKITEDIVILKSKVYNVGQGSINTNYGKFGGRFYETVDNTKIPITLSSSNKFNDNTGTEIQRLGNIVNSLWRNRLNTIGVWTTNTPNPVGEWIGFSFCVDVPSNGDYTIGIAADNRVRFKVNGNTYMSMNQFDAFTFNYWHVFNISLSSGRNVIEMEGYNDGSDASFGAEIYDVDVNTLTGITTEAALSAVTIFSTEEFRNDTSIVFDTGENSGYSCPSGFALQTCDGEATCVSIDKLSASEPCTGLTEEIVICEITKSPIEVNPLDFLDKHPSEVNVKSDMDKMIVSNLIDAKSRQTIGGYPLLWAFYELYLNASNCGNDLTGRYDYNNLFEFTDLIGDYWLDVLEQVIPATTIMDGCQNSGKVYRNNIFDQPKFPYKKYALNYFFENTDGLINGTNCTLEGVTSESIAEQRLCVDVTEIRVLGDGNSKLEKCIKEINDLQWLIDNSKAGESLKEQWREDIIVKKAECEEIARAENIISSFYPLTQHNKIFITQIYDTNEYEGDITITGDEEWDKEDELINDCSESETVDIPDVEVLESACWYSLPENPEQVMYCVTTWNCGSSNPTPPDYDHQFIINEMTINGDTIQLSTPYVEDMNAVSGGTSDINWVSANNDVVSGATTGLTYTNFVDFLNNAFTELGVYPTYKAQISTQKTVNGLSGFYIIKPQNDSFSLLVEQNGEGGIDKLYTNEGASAPGWSGAGYESSDCDNNNVVNGSVVE